MFKNPSIPPGVSGFSPVTQQDQPAHGVEPTAHEAVVANMISQIVATGIMPPEHAFSFSLPANRSEYVDAELQKTASAYAENRMPESWDVYLQKAQKNAASILEKLSGKPRTNADRILELGAKRSWRDVARRHAEDWLKDSRPFSARNQVKMHAEMHWNQLAQAHVMGKLHAAGQPKISGDDRCSALRPPGEKSRAASLHNIFSQTATAGSVSPGPSAHSGGPYFPARDSNVLGPTIGGTLTEAAAGERREMGKGKEKEQTVLLGNSYPAGGASPSGSDVDADGEIDDELPPYQGFDALTARSGGSAGSSWQPQVPSSAYGNAAPSGHVSTPATAAQSSAAKASQGALKMDDALQKMFSVVREQMIEKKIRQTGYRAEDEIALRVRALNQQRGPENKIDIKSAWPLYKNYVELQHGLLSKRKKRVPPDLPK